MCGICSGMFGWYSNEEKVRIINLENKKNKKNKKYPNA